MCGNSQCSGMAARHMQHTTMEAFYELYVMWCDGNAIPDADRAKSRLFSMIYELRWKSILQFRTVSQHARLDQLKQCVMSPLTSGCIYWNVCCIEELMAFFILFFKVSNKSLSSLVANQSVLSLRCTQCSEFTARIKQACLMDEKCQLETAQSLHIRNVRMYRQIQGRLNSLSEQGTGGGGSCTSILKIDLDGLDQSKTKYPRNTVNSKSLSGMWRPQCHIMACIVWGELQSNYLVTSFLVPWKRL